MLNATVKKEIINEVGRLGYEQQRRVLDFARALVITGPKGVPGKQLLSFAGTIPADDLKEMEKRNLSCRYLCQEREGFASGLK